MGFFRRKVNESDYDMTRKGNYRNEGKDYLPQNNGWYTCVRCGKKIRWKDTDVDHIMPQNWGGKDNAYNLQALCKHCNRSKRDKTDDTEKDLKRRRKEMDKSVKDVEKIKRRMWKDAKKEAKDNMSKKDFDSYFGKNRGKEGEEVEKAITGTDKDFNDFLNKL